MSPIKSDEDIRRAAQQLGIDQVRLRGLLNPADPHELLQRAARVLADDDREAGVVARIFGVNKKHLGDAVWYLKQNRYRQARRRGQASRPMTDDER